MMTLKQRIAVIRHGRSRAATMQANALTDCAMLAPPEVVRQAWNEAMLVTDPEAALAELRDINRWRTTVLVQTVWLTPLQLLDFVLIWGFSRLSKLWKRLRPSKLS